MNKKQILQIALLIIIFVLSYIERNNTEEEYIPEPQQEVEEEYEEEEIESVEEGKSYYVSYVVDGDTINIEEIGSIRLIGIDTPETVDPRKEVQCFGIEASNKARELLEDQIVTLELDSSQGYTDKYGRVLAYVYLEDGRMFNELMLSLGYAYEYTYNTPYKYQDIFKNEQNIARENRLGLWGDICNGQR